MLKDLMEFFQEKKLKNVAYSDHSENTGTHWVVIFMNSHEVIYFDSFGVEYIPK